MYLEFQLLKRLRQEEHLSPQFKTSLGNPISKEKMSIARYGATRL
jgi:hypothetical protein